MSSEFFLEIEALESIFPSAINCSSSKLNDSFVLTFQDPTFPVKIKFNVPVAYPNEAISNIELTSSSIPIPKLNQLHGDLILLIQENIGNEILFILIEHVRDSIESFSSVQTSNSSEKIIEIENPIGLTESIPVAPLSAFPIIHGELTMEKKSSFQSHMTRVESMEQVVQFREIVISDKKISKATHNIFAYRFTDPLTGILHSDCDDDGEIAAGGRLGEMMRLMGIGERDKSMSKSHPPSSSPSSITTGRGKGGIGGGVGVGVGGVCPSQYDGWGAAVIVSRWFGGILLGPDRFKFICNSARKLLESQGCCAEGARSLMFSTPSPSLSPSLSSTHYPSEGVGGGGGGGGSGGGKFREKEKR